MCMLYQKILSLTKTLNKTFVIPFSQPPTFFSLSLLPSPIIISYRLSHSPIYSWYVSLRFWMTSCQRSKLMNELGPSQKPVGMILTFDLCWLLLLWTQSILLFISMMDFMSSLRSFLTPLIYSSLIGELCSQRKCPLISFNFVQWAYIIMFWHMAHAMADVHRATHRQM